MTFIHELLLSFFGLVNKLLHQVVLSTSSSSVSDANHLAMGTNIVLGHLSSPLLPLLFVNVMLCPH